MQQTYSTLIIGGGIAGSALACSLAERDAGRGVGLVDPHLYGRLSSSELNGGGIRCTFAEEINLRISLKSTAYYQANADRFDFRRRGYLWLYTAELWDEARSFLPMVRSHGLPVEELTPAAAAGRFPKVLANLDDVAGVTWTPADGRLSPHLLRMHYLSVAKAGGTDLLDGWQVVAIDGDGPFRVTLRQVTPATAATALTAGTGGAERTVTAERVVNAAGPWAARVATLYGCELPVRPVPRQVFLLKHPAIDLEPEAFVLDYAQDLYYRWVERDGQSYTLVSWSDPAEVPRIDYAHAGETYYRQHVRPRIVRRVPALADATLGPGWSGHYELSPDKSAIVGPVSGRQGLFNLNGLSAHGVMQSRALGEATADLLTSGHWPADLSLESLTDARFQTAGTLRETMYV